MCRREPRNILLLLLHRPPPRFNLYGVTCATQKYSSATRRIRNRANIIRYRAPRFYHYRESTVRFLSSIASTRLETWRFPDNRRINPNPTISPIFSAGRDSWYTVLPPFRYPSVARLPRQKIFSILLYRPCLSLLTFVYKFWQLNFWEKHISISKNQEPSQRNGKILERDPEDRWRNRKKMAIYILFQKRNERISSEKLTTIFLIYIPPSSQTTVNFVSTS